MKGRGSVDSPKNPVKAEEKAINAELWHACAGPLVTLPLSGSLVVYFPQGHSEQVATCMQKDIDAQVPSYPNLPSKLICLLHSVTLHADTETDEVCAQMTLQPVNINDKEALLASDVTVNPNKPQTEFFCKTLTASDTSTHGGFSVPRRAAEKIFPPLDYTMQPPAQELQARDLHDNLWTFRHIYRGQPKRHLLTTGWSLFVSAKRLSAGDSVLFVRDDKQRLLVGIRRANRQPTNIPSSVLSSDSMHIGVLAAAANAAANRSPFTVFYNPRASPSQFVIPLAKYQKAVYGNQISVGMRFRMMFETEESGTRRYMGTITGISDLDPVRWKNSKWRNLQVGWDESAAMGEKRNKVSIWEIEPVAVPFFIFPPMFGAKRPRQPWMPDDETLEMENLFKRTMPWLSEEICIKDPLTQNTVMPGLSLSQWLTMQQNPSLTNSTMWPDYLCSLTGVTAQNFGVTNLPGQLALQAQLQHNNMQFNSHGLRQRGLVDPLSQVSLPLNPLHPITQPSQQMQDVSTHQGLQLVNQTSLFSQKQSDTMVTQPQVILHTQALEQQQQQQPSLQCIQAMQTGLQSNQLQQQHLQQLLQQQQPQSQQQNRMSIQPPNQGNEESRWPEYHIQMQLLQRLQQQTLQSTLQQPQMPQLHEHQRGLQKKPQVLLDSNSLSQQQAAPQQHLKVPPPDAQSIQSSQHHSEQMLQQQQVLLPELPGIILPLSTNFLSTTDNSLLAAGGVSVLTNGIPACLASPSRNKCANISQQIVNRSHQQNTVTVDKTPLTAVTVTNPYSLCELTASPKVTKEMSKSENNEKPLLLASQLNKHGAVSPQAYPSNTVQVDYLDTTSSATSACFSQTDGPFQQSFHASPGSKLQDNDLNDAAFSVNVDGKLGIPLSTSQLLANDIGSGKFQNHMSGNVVACYNTPKEAQEELSSSMISQSFGVPDMAFNSIDSTFNESEFLNRNSWAPPQYQRTRTYTKVYKRGAVGRSIDITRYSCYDGLKQDLARMFNIEGQLENRQRRGWKLVYVDHENDLLLVGDDPWEEFVRCVRCIRILSPQEVEQISLDGDLRNGICPNQACSSSDGGNTWEGTV